MEATKTLPKGSTATIESLSKLAEIICESGELPASSEVVTTILNLRSEDQFSAQELASIILKDYGLTHRILRMANSCYFNPSGQEITTVSRAIVLLGVEFVREMALAATLFEVLMKKVPPEGHKSLLSFLAQSYLCAFLARPLAPYLRADTEEIFIYALFHRIGRILLAIYSPGTLLRWEELEKERPQLVKKRLFQLMERVMLCWSLPLRLVETLEGSPKALEESSLASWMSRLDEGVQEFTKRGEIRSLEALFSRMGIEKEDFKRHLVRAQETIREFWPAMAEALKLEKPPEEPAICQTPEGEDFYQRALREITGALALQRTNYQEILLMVIETIARAFNCENVYLAVPQMNRTSLLIKYGIGPKAKHLKRATLLSGAFFKKIFVKGIEWSGPVENLPEPNILARFSPGRDLLISPLSIDGRGVGAILALRSEPFTLEEKQKVETLRHLAILAIRQAR